MKTHQPNRTKIVREWHLMDASKESLGRLASRAAYLLIGKNKLDYAPNYDMGDYVVVTNAKLVKVTGDKANQKVYRGHSGYPGGFKEVSFKKWKNCLGFRISKPAIILHYFWTFVRNH